MAVSKEHFRSLLSFSLPLILSAVMQQLYQWADAFIVGNVEGEVALAAIGSTTSVTNLFVNVMTGFTLGLAILFAQRYGQNRKKEMGAILSTFSLVVGLVFTVLAILAIAFCHQLLTLMDTTEETIALAQDYLSLVFIGMPFLAVYNVYSAAVRGNGDSRAPFHAVLVSSLANVVLDIVFVAFLGMSVRGAAIATTVSQIAMTVYLVVHTSRKYSHLRFSFTLAHDRKSLREGSALGLPPMLQNSVTSIGSLILQNFMNSFGTLTVAAITTAYRIDSIVMLPILNLSSGISTMVAQSRGAGDMEKGRSIFSSGLVLMTIISLLLTAIVIPTGGFLISLFGAGGQVVAIGSDFFVRLASFYIIFGLANAIRGYVEGMGDVKFSSIAGMISLAVRIAGSYMMRPLFGNMVIAWAEALAWLVLLGLYLMRLLAFRRRAERI